VQIRAGDEPAQAPVPGGVAGQQHEMRAALPRPDSPQVLLDRPLVTRQPGAVRADVSAVLRTVLEVWRKGRR